MLAHKTGHAFMDSSCLPELVLEGNTRKEETREIVLLQQGERIEHAAADFQGTLESRETARERQGSLAEVPSLVLVLQQVEGVKHVVAPFARTKTEMRNRVLVKHRAFMNS